MPFSRPFMCERELGRVVGALQGDGGRLDVELELGGARDWKLRHGGGGRQQQRAVASLCNAGGDGLGRTRIGRRPGCLLS